MKVCDTLVLQISPKRNFNVRAHRTPEARGAGGGSCAERG